MLARSLLSFQRISARAALTAALVPAAAFTTVTATTPSAQAAEDADALFKKGNALYKEKKWQAAYDAYKQAYALEQRYDIAGNLGDVSLTLGKFREAAEYLSHALRTMPEEKAALKKQVQTRLEQAKKEVGTLSITVNVEGANVTCNDREVGKAPLTGEVFVEAGATSVVVRADGHKEARRTVALTKGETKALEITLQVDPNAGAVPVGPAGSGGSGGLEPAGGDGGMEPVGGAGGSADANGGVSSDGMSTKTIVLISGGALAVVGLGVGIGFTIAKSSAKDDQESLIAQAEREVGVGQCSAGASVCDDIDEANDRGRRAATLSTIGFIGMGVGLAAVAAGVLMPSNSQNSSALPVRVGGSFYGSSVNVSLAGSF